MGRCNNLAINFVETRVVRTDHKQASVRPLIYRLAERGWRFIGAFSKLRKATISFVTFVRPSVRPSLWTYSDPTGSISMKCGIRASLENRSKIHVSLTSRKNSGTLHKDLCIYMIIFHWVFRRGGNVSDKICRQKQNPHFMFNNIFFENLAVYEIMWENMVESKKPQMTIWCMCIACWVTRATITLRICNIYCFSSTTMVAGTRLVVTLYVHWLSFFL